MEKLKFVAICPDCSYKWSIELPKGKRLSMPGDAIADKEIELCPNCEYVYMYYVSDR